ncbi:hypothetical protein ISF_07716 [Cordyceps fumosorosea ARSEF 2679]|uniref:Uncharacterized protein n=1 Tax=Cordyceps fumosorosea (strain ARSEF 2679) TaxID=1081104 RepID=A0A167NZJ8_CORFA|nr:hypothetical protein ISF_07716 [Cordyceps fumosorosea ARSEF 2679]OAA56118.1 hypothetical protein ISF_07716 [Cordyceps fumosorosea ARSEF 2679]
MGCTSSKLADPSADDHPAATLSKRLDEIGEATELEWACRPTWGQYMAYLYEQAKSAGGSTKKLRANFEQVVNATALDFLKTEYPESAAAGTTEDLHYDEGPYGSGEAAVVRTKLWLTLDEGFNGIAYAYTLVVHSPMAWQSVADADGAGLPARVAASPQMKLAQRYMSSIVGTMDKQQGANVRHAIINIVIGSVMVSARYKPHNVTPSLALISENDGPELRQPTDVEKTEPSSHPQRLFRSHLFVSVLATLEADYPGCTVWDAGAMPFRVDEQPYAHPARLLVCRDYEKRNKDVDTLDFKVERPDDDSTVATLVRARDPAEDPGGVICLAVVITVDPEDPWPRRDHDRHRAVIDAALEHASKHGLLMALLRGFDARCALRVWAGQDSRRYTLVAPHPKGSTAEHARQFSELVFGGPIEPPLRPPEPAADVAGLEEEFGVKVSRKQGHRLWASESQFRGARHAMRERAKADPARYEQFSILAGYESAATFMARNFGDAVVGDEGELPQPEGVARLENTKVLVARDPRQEPSSVVAVLVAAPCPVPGRGTMFEGGGSTWLATPEMKRAEEALLALLKRWHKQGKVSTVDCFAQVMMGVDASIYQFVDGDKFVDYSEERMKQLQWQ